jgi:hypothetical protein
MFLKPPYTYGIYTEPKGFFSVFRRLATIDINNRVNKTFGITTELKITSQITNFVKQILSFLAYAGSSIVNTLNETSLDMWGMVTVVEISVIVTPIL